MRFHFFTILIGLILSNFPSFAAGSGITYHGRLLDPSDNAVNSSNVQFKIQIRTPGNENCLMYEEIQSKDMSNSDGIFSITINDGSGSRTDSSGLGLDQIFANRGAFNFPVGYCVTGSNYAPNSTDGRKLQVYFNDGTFAAGQWEPTPSMAINFIPMAIESQQVGGYKKEQILKLADGVSTTGTELDASKWTSLLALINGTSTAYTKPTDQVTQLYGSPVPAPANGQSIRWNSALNSGSGGWENFTAGSSSAVTSVTAGTGLNVGAGPGGSITTTGTLNIDVGTTTGKIVQVAAANKLPAIDGSNLSNINATSVGGTAVSLVSLSNGQVLKYNGTNWVNATLTDNDTLGGLSCANGRVAYYTAGSWACLEVASANTVNTIVARDGSGVINMSTANMGSLKINNGAMSDITLTTPAAFTSYAMKLPTSVGTNGYVLTTDGASPAQLSWSAMSSSQWTTSGSDIYYTAGKVGIGTTNILRPLTLKNSTSNSTILIDRTLSSTSSQIAYSTNYLGGSAPTPATPIWFTGMQDSGTISGAEYNYSINRHDGSSMITSLTIDPSGHVGIGTAAPTQALEVVGTVQATDFVSTSDRRLKKDITSIEDALDKIMQINGVSWHWLSDGSSDIGVIAQDVEKVFPDLVVTNSNGKKSVKYGNLVGPLIEAVKTLKSQLDSQQKQIDSLLILQSENEKLKNRIEQLEKKMNSISSEAR